MLFLLIFNFDLILEKADTFKNLLF